MLEIRGVTKVYRSKTGEEVKALDNVSISFPEQGMVFILGKSGSGKSTLLNVMGGLDSYDSGEFIIKGKSSNDFQGSDFDAYRNTFIGFIFQEYNVLDDFTVGANIGLALELQGKKATEEKINEILASVDLLNYAHRKPNELSGGQKQRVAIARALVKEPQIIMADEPTGALDSNTGKQIFDTLKELSKTKLVLIVSHDRDFAERYADRIVELADGKIIEDVTKHDHMAEKISDGVHRINDNILRIESGYKLTAKDLDMINAYLAGANGDVLLSGDGRVNDELRSAAGIGKDGSTSVFENTRPDEDIKTRQYEKHESKFIRSKLPMKNAVKMGSSGLKHKKFRLAMTILLSLVAFAMFGLADTMAAYEKINAATESIIDSNVHYAAMKLGVRRTLYYNDGDTYVNYDTAALNDSDIAYLKNEAGLDFVPVYTGAADRWNSGFSMSDNFINYQSNQIYTGKMAGLVNMTDAMLAQAGLTVSGRLPAAEGEIAISDLLYKQLNEYGFKYVSGNKTERIEAGELQKEGEGENSILGKTLRFKSSHNGYEFSYTVVGVVDTGFDYSRYQAFMPTNEPNTNNDGSGITDMVLGAELENVLAYSFHALGFVMNEDIVKIAENTFVSQKEIGTYMSGWNSSTYFLISRYAPEGGEGEGGKSRDMKFDVIVDSIGGIMYPGAGSSSNAAWERNMHRVAKSETLRGLTVTWFDGTPREVLGANEIVISEQVWRDMQAQHANITITAKAIGDRVDACFGAGAWAATDPNNGYSERLVEAYKRYYLTSEIRRVAAKADLLDQFKMWFNSSVPEYTASIEDAATLEAALRWYFFGEDGTAWRNEQTNVGYGEFINWQPLYNAELNAFKAFLPQLNEMFGTSFEDDDALDRIHWTMREFLNIFNANDESEDVSFTQFQDMLRRYYGYRDLVANNYFINNERFVADLLACEGLDVTQAEWDSYSDTEHNDQSKLYWAERFYLDYFLSNYEYREYEPYLEGAKTQSDFENMSKQMVLKLSGKTEAELLGTLTFERIVNNYETGTIATEKAYDFTIVGTFKEPNQLNSDLVISDTLYNDYMTWYESNAGDYGYREEIAPHDDGIWAFALAPLTSDATVIEKLVTMSYDRENGLQFQMQNAVMNTLSNFNSFIEEGAKIFLYVGLGFALFSALLLMNFIATSISYKKRDIGILRAVGARSSDVFKIFFSEALIIALINFAMAIVALVATTIGLNTWMRNSGINITLLNVGVRQIVLMLGVSVLVALLASFLPVNSIARKKPVDAIKDR